MRTNIDIDDELMQQAMAATNAPTKKAVVEEALKLFVQIKGQGAIRELRGKIVWRGHDDDWSASDEKILAKRNHDDSDPLMAQPDVVLSKQDEEFQLTGGQGRR